MPRKIHRIRQGADYRFILIGISSHARDYRLGWEIHRNMGIRLVRHNDFTVTLRRKSGRKRESTSNGDVQSSFSLYICHSEENRIVYYLVSNRCHNGVLIPEQKMADYFLIVKGAIPRINREDLIHRLKSISLVRTVFPIEPEKLKSGGHFLVLDDPNE